jgi:hypothetical protein
MSAFLGKLTKSITSFAGRGGQTEEVKSGESSGKASTAESQERPPGCDNMSDLAFILSQTEEERKAEKEKPSNIEIDQSE